MKARAGFALIGALWLMVAISVAGAELAMASQLRRLAAANTAEELQAREAARALLEQSRARLDERIVRANAELPPISPLYDPWLATNALLPDSMTVGPAVAVADVHDPGGRLHLNKASEDELARFFSALSGNSFLGVELAARVADWRDIDQQTTPGGAEADAYLAAGLHVVPRDGPFQDIRELQHVLGMTAALYAAAFPHVTTAGSGRINLNVAEKPVLLALPGMSEEAANAALALREANGRILSILDISNQLPVAQRLELQGNAPALAARTVFSVNEVVVRVRAHVPNSPRIVELEALVSRTPEYGRVQEVRWR